ncbi:MAG TPA: tetratricopeptide repeat protein, partial [Longimicrobiales bacterium]|nr:tetratricopeptide repeat protein [Longimicrobiales bacterium]
MREALMREIQELRLLVGSARDPDGRVFAQLGDALRRAGELDEALDVLREGVDDHPHFTPGHVALGWAAQSSGDLDSALATFRKALALDPENPFSLFGAGVLLAARGEESGPLLVEQALELHPEVRSWVPRITLGSGPLHGLPFMSLADLAPPPFMSLAELAPTPFMTLSELAPGPEAEAPGGLPFMALEELTPDLQSMAGPPALLPDASDDPGGMATVGGGPDPDDVEEEDATPVTRT